MSEETAKAAGGKIYTSGSYRLRIHEPSSDIDAICVAPQVRRVCVLLFAYASYLFLSVYLSVRFVWMSVCLRVLCCAVCWLSLLRGVSVQYQTVSRDGVSFLFNLISRCHYISGLG